uniref:Immunoglobulin V-set domain-containing protein n=1 Tax=Neolamprologus brichardi TaxID=32507 RepID=A0A3Q4I9C8_NEOBR
MLCCSSATLTCHLTLFIFLTDSCCDTVTKVQSYEGYSESFSCPYESQYQNSLKYICRGNQPSTCLQQALITSDTKQNGRFRLDDDKVSGTFTVTINSLVKGDSGSYLCGVQRNSELDVFSAVELKVKVGETNTCVHENNMVRAVSYTLFSDHCVSVFYNLTEQNYVKHQFDTR